MTQDSPGQAGTSDNPAIQRLAALIKPCLCDWLDDLIDGDEADLALRLARIAYEEAPERCGPHSQT